MSSSFFLKNSAKAGKKRKLPTVATGSKSARGKPNRGRGGKAPPTKRRPQKDDEEIVSEDEVASGLEEDAGPLNLVFSSDEGETETPQDKRLRLAKQYLEQVQQQEAEKAEDRGVHDHVAQRLQSEYLDSVGRLRRYIADRVVGYEEAAEVSLKHKMQHLPVCSLVLTPDGKYLFTGAKTQHVLKWDLEARRVVGSLNVQKHTEEAIGKLVNGKKRRSHVIAMCLSSDSKFLALAEGGNSVQIWCPETLKHLKTFSGHRDVVTSLVFRRDTHDLYTGSKDRSVKIWSLDEMAYVETLFGHQAAVTGIDALSRERAITSGGTDCTLRVWKITEESQLIYNGHQGSIEAVKFLNDETFVSGGDDGSLCLWSAMKKKALHTEKLVHGVQENGSAYWITALACVINTDIIATGSWNGQVRLWRTTDNGRKLESLLDIPLDGFVNALAFDADGRRLFAAVGQEHRDGRWWRIPQIKNRICIIKLSLSAEKKTKRES